MSELKPTQIFAHFKSGKFDSKSALDALIHIIETDSNTQIRLEALTYLGEIPLFMDNQYKFLENLAISDKKDELRTRAAEIIINKYLGSQRHVIEGIIEHEGSPLVLLALYKNLERKENQTSEQLREYLKEVMLNQRFKEYRGEGIKDENLDVREELGLSKLERYLGDFENSLNIWRETGLLYEFELADVRMLFEELKELAEKQGYSIGLLRLLEEFVDHCIERNAIDMDKDDYYIPMIQNNWLKLSDQATQLGLELDPKNQEFLRLKNYIIERWMSARDFKANKSWRQLFFSQKRKGKVKLSLIVIGHLLNFISKEKGSCFSEVKEIKSYLQSIENLPLDDKSLQKITNFLPILDKREAEEISKFGYGTKNTFDGMKIHDTDETLNRNYKMQKNKK